MNNPVIRSRGLQLAATRRHADLTKTDMEVLKGLLKACVPWSGDYEKAKTDIITDRELEQRNGKAPTFASIARNAGAGSTVRTVKASLPRLVKMNLIEIAPEPALKITTRNLAQMENWITKDAVKHQSLSEKRKRDAMRQKKRREERDFVQVPTDGKSRARLYTEILGLTSWQPQPTPIITQASA